MTATAPDLSPETIAGVVLDLDRFRKTRRWRHLWVAAIGLLASMVGELGVILILSHRDPGLGGRPRVPLYAAVFMAGTVVAAFGWQRFNVRRTVARYPLTVVSLVVLVPLLALLGDWSESSPYNESVDSPLLPFVQAAVPDAGGLAGSLLDTDLMEGVLGRTFFGPEPGTGALVRSRSMARYHGETDSGRRVLTITVSPRGRTPKDVARERAITVNGSRRPWHIQVGLFGHEAEGLRTHAEAILAGAMQRLVAGLEAEAALRAAGAASDRS